MSSERLIRSFVRRTGRMTPSQQQALSDLLPVFGLQADAMPPLAEVFGEDTPVTLEIGFGNGESLAALGRQFPERGFIGIEVHTPGIGRLLREVAVHELRNIRVIEGDALVLLRETFTDAAFAGINIWFPDPWPKKKHRKRRLVNAENIALISSRLRPGGILHLATDWQPYAEQMLAVCDAEATLENLAGGGCYAADKGDRPLTKFERRGLKLGHGVWDLRYTRH